MKFFIATICGLTVAILAAGCTSHPRRVDCERNLKPINAPAQATSATGRP